MKRIPAAAAITLAASAGATGALATGTAGAAPQASAARSYTVNVVRTGLGKILVDRQGLTLYMFTRDPRNTDTCRAIKDCLGVWPELTTKSAPTAGPGVKQTLLGTIRVGRRTQVTYAGHPLYEYAQNNTPGATGYIGTPEFGGLWYGVTPAGKAVK